jgi:hypothetical protein
MYSFCFCFCFYMFMIYPIQINLKSSSHILTTSELDRKAQICKTTIVVLAYILQSRHIHLLWPLATLNISMLGLFKTWPWPTKMILSCWHPSYSTLGVSDINGNRTVVIWADPWADPLGWHACFKLCLQHLDPGWCTSALDKEALPSKCGTPRDARAPEVCLRNTGAALAVVSCACLAIVCPWVTSIVARGDVIAPTRVQCCCVPAAPGPEYTLKLLALAGWAIIPRAIKTPKHRSATTLLVVAMVYRDVHAGNRREERENINDKSVLSLHGILDICVKYQFAPRETPMPSELLHFQSV